MRSIGINLQPWLDGGLLRCHAARPSLQGLEPHLASMIKDVDDFKPHVAVVDPLSALLSSGTLDQTHGMLLRLIDHLKTVGVTALFTGLQLNDDQTGLTVSSIMDTWLLVRNTPEGNDVVRRLQVIKSRGMWHSTQLRVMEIGKEGVQVKRAPPVPTARKRLQKRKGQPG
jgi:circadian clock protein KaiC